MPAGMFAPAAEPATVPEPDDRSAGRYLWWLFRIRPWPVVLSTLLGVLWMIPLALLPLAVGRAIDQGVRDGAAAALVGWVVVILVLAAVQAVAGAALIQAAVGAEMHAVSVTHRVLARQLTRLGSALRHRTRAGDVTTVAAGDVESIGDAYEVLGRSSGAVFSFVLVALVLMVTSPLLGLVVLVGVPASLLAIGPLLRPLRRRNEEQRDRMGAATAQAGDIVAGLRVLRGVGGERRFSARFARTSQQVRRTGESAGRMEAWLAAAGVFLPGLVTILVAWLGARLVLEGVITPGELVAFYGTSAFLAVPVSTATEAVESLSVAYVAAGRVCRILRLDPRPGPSGSPCPLPPGPLALSDDASGFRAEAGRLTVVTTTGAAATRTAARIARQHPGPADGVSVAGVRVEDADPAAMRDRVLVCGHADTLFSGPLRDELACGIPHPDPVLRAALHAAAAEDVLDAVPRGLDGLLPEAGRSLSGGQRQRLLLARALLAERDVLVLDDPTSAVDASTEARIVRRVAGHRAGRTTVVFSSSPLWSNAADDVRVLVPDAPTDLGAPPPPLDPDDDPGADDPDPGGTGDGGTGDGGAGRRPGRAPERTAR